MGGVRYFWGVGNWDGGKVLSYFIKICIYEYCYVLSLCEM